MIARYLYELFLNEKKGEHSALIGYKYRILNNKTNYPKIMCENKKMKANDYLTVNQRATTQN